jgi:hypothetical protein
MNTIYTKWTETPCSMSTSEFVYVTNDGGFHNLTPFPIPLCTLLPKLVWEIHTHLLPFLEHIEPRRRIVVG